MEDPSLLLRDLRFDSDLSHLSEGQDEVQITLSPFKEMLAIKGNAVYWYKGDLLARKLEYETPVVNSFFTYLVSRGGSQDSDSSTQTREKTLVVLLSELIYIYYRDGRSYILSFPFPIKHGYPYENGVVLERGDTTSNPFVTMTEPLAEFGSIVSSSTSSISSNENLVLFPQTSDYSVTITINESDNSLNLYHTRFLHRSNNSMLKSSTANLRRKPSQASRKSSIVNPNGEISESQKQGDEIKVEKKKIHISFRCVIN